ncbi:MAG: hypothetical protein MUF64_21010 [Polyangiaceae bacterium]|nr:hypothetical protein [Polyangiaceae bacterium]
MEDAPGQEPREVLERWRQRLLVGPWRSLEPELRGAFQEAQRRRRPFLEHGLANLLRELALLQGRADPALPQRVAAGPVQRIRGEILGLRLVMRGGGADPDRCRRLVEEAAQLERSRQAGVLLAAEELLRTGAPRSAYQALEEELRGEASWPQALLRELALDAAVLGAMPREIEENAAVLEGTPGPRFRQASALAKAWQAREMPVDFLGDLVENSDPELPATRRAFFLLGRSSSLDRLDAQVTGALLERWGQARRAPVPRSEVAPASLLLLDPHGMRLQVGGKVLELARTPLFARVLLVLIQQGGAASKEQLVRGAWGLRSYTPTRDDNRLQVTVGRLRKLLGGPLVVACEGGYRLAMPSALASLEQGGVGEGSAPGSA